MSDQENEELRLIIEGFCAEVEAARNHHNRPKGGQQVPFHGDFANVALSALNRLEWWARAMKEALNQSEEIK